jgi:hypothetical protein
LQLDGKVVTAGFTPALDSAVGGVTPPPVSTRDMVVARYNANGTVDSTFG